ncbi:probable ERG6 S-adenosyl-methionine delta-24-sterol-c-methyltransferase [Rhynchosporium graminicola]|uniref:Probable ERG6 S-adenosyl-methionine delta-24-sterol-c-methyltransferase n=1 Tax=Rhynchosporium graminicola TaxID=2792576 RepID=A0A1E1KXK9_9HELO|nr:probable ERG6 S-adenosyl-methionine delta-24-sterol-c-methyltransferase [Rhynchosporium commune]
MPSTEREPVTNKNEMLKGYYKSLESRIGYRLVLGRTRHFGYYTPGTYWPFPIGEALRAMEDRLIRNLALEKNSKVLDAGCGVGNVAIHLAKNGYYVQAIDLIDHHLVKAQRNIKAFDVEGKVTASKGDYHHLENFADNSFDGAYTMETVVHATGPEKAAAEFFRVIRPGGSLAMYEYDHADFSTKPEAVGKSWTSINKYSAMPAYDRFKQGVLDDILEKAVFEIVTVEDISDNVLPMMRMFYILEFIPYMIIALLGLKHKFTNTVAGYEGYVHRDASRYISVSARKPSVPGSEVSKEAKKSR